MRWIGWFALAVSVAPATVQAQYAVKPGGSVRLKSLYSVDTDCTSLGYFTISMILDPHDGKLRTVKGTAYPRFMAPNPRTKCNTTLEPATIVYYEPNPGFVGTDTVTFDAIGPRGRIMRVAAMIAVK